MLNLKVKSIPITDNQMTRFNISLQDGCEMVFYAIEKAWGGEVFIPKIQSYKISDVVIEIVHNIRHASILGPKG